VNVKMKGKNHAELLLVAFV